jgi:hypothetical protein
MKIEFARGMTVDAVAVRILRALEKNRAETVLGSDARWLLRVNRFLPRLVDRLLARRVCRLYGDSRPRVSPSPVGSGSASN